MSRYEVEIKLEAIVWMDVEADSEEEAIAHAEKTYRLGDAQYEYINDTSAMKYAEDVA